MPDNRPIIHYRNLSRGLLCGHDTPHARVIRLQSTWCEQKRWGDILFSLGADFYYSLANGAMCMVHDVSEKERETRACWQGFTWVRFASQLMWYGQADPAIVRGGHNASGYFQEQYDSLVGPREKTALYYFRQYAVPWEDRGVVESCYSKGES